MGKSSKKLKQAEIDERLLMKEAFRAADKAETVGNLTLLTKSNALMRSGLTKTENIQQLNKLTVKK